MTPEEKAREAAEASFSANELCCNCIANIDAGAKLYLAGHAEAQRWRDPAVELPPAETEVLIQWEERTASGGRFITHDVALYRTETRQFTGWRDYGINVRWRPIGPLPKVKA